ncbi:MAG TPA: hypothetical protein VN442_15360 [Bryobacteraceae bacterium]|nr:hypothetical protein [Bryobacteraceae bacterium]
MFIALILTSVIPATAQQPPPDLARRVAQMETATRDARGHYTYRQSVSVQELDSRGARLGEYREVRDIVFSPAGERTEQIVEAPRSSLKRLVLTEEDFRDVREIQPFVMTTDELWIYETRFRGEEKMDDVDCWVLQVRPRQTLQGQRLFDGMLWVAKTDYSIVRMEGQAVPRIYSGNNENLFPRFTTLRKPVDGKHWFPYFTYSDDVLPFRTGPLRTRMTIRYTDYKRFGAESSVAFDEPK